MTDFPFGLPCLKQSYATVNSCKNGNGKRKAQFLFIYPIKLCVPWPYEIPLICFGAFIQLVKCRPARLVRRTSPIDSIIHINMHKRKGLGKRITWFGNPIPWIGNLSHGMEIFPMERKSIPWIGNQSYGNPSHGMEIYPIERKSIPSTGNQPHKNLKYFIKNTIFYLIISSNLRLNFVFLRPRPEMQENVLSHICLKADTFRVC